MNPKPQIVHSGGWVERRQFGRPKLRWYLTATGAWLPISALSLWLIFTGATGPGITGFTLLCGAFVLPQLVFGLLAFHFWRTETPHPFTETVKNPDCDPNCLY
jgi:hypothetical protein